MTARDGFPFTATSEGDFRLWSPTAHSSFRKFLGGRFRARVDILELPDAHVADIRQRGVSVYDAGITITERAPQSLEVQINTDGSRIDGIARIEGQPTRPGMMVVLAPPPTRRQNRALYKVTFTDSDGRFVFRGVPPEISNFLRGTSLLSVRTRMMRSSPASNRPVEQFEFQRTRRSPYP